MAAREEAQLLILAASKDFRALQGMIDTNIFADEIFGFHAQQAVEKALKAWLAFLSIEYPKTHDISLLLSMLSTNSQSVESYYDLIEFNPYAVQLRYEAFGEIGEPLERSSVSVRVGELIRKIEKLIASTN